MELSKQSKVTLSLGTIAGVLGGAWVAFQWVDAKSDEIEAHRPMIVANSEAAASIAKSLRLNSLADQIGDLKRERRSTKEKLLKATNEDLIQEYIDDIEEIDEEIEELERVRDCIIDGKEVCG